MNWRYVFNTAHKYWGDMDKGRDGAESAGYKFFTWNGWVYITDSKAATGIEVSALQ